MSRSILPIVPAAVALLFVAYAAVCDLRTRRIPNRLVLLCLPAALASQLANAGWRGVADGAAAAGIAFAVMGAGYLLGGMGAGDVKLMSAMGAFSGLHSLMLLMTSTALAGGVVGLLVLSRSTEPDPMSGGVGVGSPVNPRRLTIPYALPIACGVSVVFFRALGRAA